MIGQMTMALYNVQCLGKDTIGRRKRRKNQRVLSKHQSKTRDTLNSGTYIFPQDLYGKVQRNGLPLRELILE
jgi:hypothetical protein